MPTTRKQDEALREYAEWLGYPQCHYCRHTNHDGTCSAFPDGVPSEILANEFDHRKPFPGDNGIRFKGAELKTVRP